MKDRLRRIVPGPALSLYHFFRDGDAAGVGAFLRRRDLRLALSSRLSLLRRFYAVSRALPCPHTEPEMLEVAGRILALPPGVPGRVVEAGCYRGGSTAKLSLASRIAGRRVTVFDSFQGLPESPETNVRNIFGETVRFSAGDYRAGLEEVKAGLTRWGAPEVCEFRPGWFEETMPLFSGAIAVLFVDVDLASSTRAVLKHLYPRLSPGGTLFSHDGHLAPVIEVFRDRDFWRNEVGVELPAVAGLGDRKLIRWDKPA